MSNPVPSAYQNLKNRFAEIYHLTGALGILQWDRDVVMPVGGAEQRASQIATLATLQHSRLAAPEVGGWLADMEHRKDGLSSWDAENLALMAHRYHHATALPADLVYAFTEASAQCDCVWQQAKASNDFTSYAPHQKRVIALVRDVAQAKADALGVQNPYDALMDEYDRGRTVAQVNTVFTRLKEALPPMIEQALSQQPPAPESPFTSHDVTLQKQLCEQFMRLIGYDTTRGRLDVSVHPFSSGAMDDVRITTRFGDDAWEGLMSTLHETGHALYEQNLPRAWQGQPVGDALGMSIHESQSLFVEMQLGRSREFFHFAFPLVCAVFGAAVPNESARASLYHRYVRVEPGLIRVNADEMTYPLHIILRFELEQALISGAMEYNHVPEAWNVAMKQYLGLDVPTYAQGCMQDTHWAGGAFGYFPSYTLGAIHAAQCMATVKQQLPDVLHHLREGDISGVMEWLKTNIHQQASHRDATDLMAHACGAPLDVEVFLQHLRARYLLWYP